ncbi:hypothetical protein L209DRAFT_756296, partial [Thermothelomyces heterothallicus CBS 203.75]
MLWRSSLWGVTWHLKPKSSPKVHVLWAPHQQRGAGALINLPPFAVLAPISLAHKGSGLGLLDISGARQRHL